MKTIPPSAQGEITALEFPQRLEQIISRLWLHPCPEQDVCLIRSICALLIPELPEMLIIIMHERLVESLQSAVQHHDFMNPPVRIITG
jgi:hypothetical protein